MNVSQNSKILISIIIPTYNIENYLSECLTSILSQSFTNFEVIIIDDCSSDSTKCLIEYFMKKDYRIRLFENEHNVGPGISRNRGIEYARGKYVMFVDGDDWLDVDCLDKLFKCAEEYHTDMVMFKGLNFDDSSNRFYKNDYFSIPCLDRLNNSLFSFDDIHEDELFEIFVGPVNKLYLRSSIVDCGARFSECLTHEDNPFFYRAFCAADKIFLLDDYFYNRRVRSGSITNLRGDVELDTILVVEDILKVFIDNGLYNHFKEFLLNRLLFKLRNRYRLVGDDYKEEYFLRAKAKLDKFFSVYTLFDDFVKCLWSENRLFFDRLVFSESFEEFLYF
ncbi:MAG: glycosyltransferase family 2 protein [Methanosphaera sp.]|nr:glycosyltransferase family 2 protein [Methanosphaera sp.]